MEPSWMDNRNTKTPEKLCGSAVCPITLGALALCQPRFWFWFPPAGPGDTSRPPASSCLGGGAQLGAVFKATSGSVCGRLVEPEAPPGSEPRLISVVFTHEGHEEASVLH
ncbi:hypothetical protein EYF80_031535 [Liparis tanakae]|uniref:Uncharacterized protein n=1 Tax=Liparis tanakae TaxID=230148 RepID=A0A4Z2GZN1_9TELE|nr:hypothetical protein EYF80_031535 [Liparis tanakae]